MPAFLCAVFEKYSFMHLSEESLHTEEGWDGTGFVNSCTLRFFVKRIFEEKGEQLPV